MSGQRGGAGDHLRQLVGHIEGFHRLHRQVHQVGGGELVDHHPPVRLLEGAVLPGTQHACGQVGRPPFGGELADHHPRGRQHLVERIHRSALTVPSPAAGGGNHPRQQPLEHDSGRNIIDASSRQQPSQHLVGDRRRRARSTPAHHVAQCSKTARRDHLVKAGELETEAPTGCPPKYGRPFVERLPLALEAGEE